MGKLRGLNKRIRKLERLVKLRDGMLEYERTRSLAAEKCINALLNKIGSMVELTNDEIISAPAYMAKYSEEQTVFVKQAKE